MNVPFGRRKPLLLVALTCLVIVALAFIEFVQFSRESLLAQDIQNFGHVIVFAILAAAVYAGVRLLVDPRHGRARSVGLSAVILVALGLVSEALQMSTSRSADLGDLFRNLVGAYAGLTACAVFARPTETERATRRRISIPTFLALLLALTLLAATLVPVALGLSTSLERNQAFPDLLPKSAQFVSRYVQADSVQWIDDSEEFPFVRCVLTDRLFPGVILADPVADWQAFRSLSLRYRLTGPESQEFFLLVDLCNQPDEDLPYRYELPLRSGEHEIRVDLASAQGAFVERTALRCVERLYIKTANVDSSLTLDIYSLRLEH